jgi:hypothetical protein
MSGMEVAEKLGRSYKAVMMHASKLGLSKRNPNARQQPQPAPKKEKKNAPRKSLLKSEDQELDAWGKEVNSQILYSAKPVDTGIQVIK